jgi:hypothetical protein
MANNGISITVASENLKDRKLYMWSRKNNCKMTNFSLCIKARTGMHLKSSCYKFWRNHKPKSNLIYHDNHASDNAC